MFSFAEAKDASPLADVVLLGNSFQALELNGNRQGPSALTIGQYPLFVHWWSFIHWLSHSRSENITQWRFIGRGFRFIFLVNTRFSWLTDIKPAFWCWISRFDAGNSAYSRCVARGIPWTWRAKPGDHWPRGCSRGWRELGVFGDEVIHAVIFSRTRQGDNPYFPIFPRSEPAGIFIYFTSFYFINL